MAKRRSDDGFRRSCFVSAQLSADQSNIAADSNYHTIVFDTEHYDGEGAYNASNGTFTAPVSGQYLVTFNLQVQNVDVDGMTFIIGRTYGGSTNVKPRSSNKIVLTPALFDGSDTSTSVEGSLGQSAMVVYIPVGDTLVAQIIQVGGTAQMDVYGSNTEGWGSMLQIRLLG